MSNITAVRPDDVEADVAGRPWLSRQLARVRSAWPHGPLRMFWPGLGELRISISGLAPIENQRSTAGVGTCESFALWRAGRHGRLDVDARFAVASAGLLLGTAGAFPMSRVLSPAERGAFGALVALVLDANAAPLAVAIEAPDAVPLRLDLQVELDLFLTPVKNSDDRSDGAQGPAQTSMIVGWARIFVPWSWFETSATLWSNLARVPFPAALQVARTRLELLSLGSLQVGDALVFDGYAVFSTSHTFAANLVIGAFCSAAQVTGDSVRLTGPFAPMDTLEEPATTLPIAAGRPTWKGTSAMSSTVEMAAMSAAPPPAAPSASLTQALVNTPIEVVAEIGRFVLTGAELAGLEQGEVFSFGTASKGTITLSVAGRQVAKGALVNIDGTFGVRITERY